MAWANLKINLNIFRGATRCVKQGSKKIFLTREAMGRLIETLGLEEEVGAVKAPRYVALGRNLRLKGNAEGGGPRNEGRHAQCH